MCVSFYFVCFVFLKVLRLVIAALWSPAGKGLTSWRSFVVYTLRVCHFPMCYPRSGVVLDCIFPFLLCTKMHYFVHFMRLYIF